MYRTRLPNASDARGFTLLEVMVSLAILAGVILTLLASFNYHAGVAADDKDLIVASVLGRYKADEIGLMGEPSRAGGPFEEPFTGFNWSAEKKDAEFPGLKRFEVLVSWRHGYVPFTAFTLEK